MKRIDCQLPAADLVDPKTLQSALDSIVDVIQRSKAKLSMRGPVVLTIGNFDGLHLGHQNLIAELLAKAHQYKMPSTVFTFDPHPMQFLHPERKLERLFPRADLAEMLENRGVDCFVQFQFNEVFANLTPMEFLDLVLVPLLNPKHLVVGYDFGFGKNKVGNLDFLKEEAAKRNWGLSVVEPFFLESKIVSSSRIRESLKDGDAEEARLLLGRPYYLTGHVFKGFQRGRTIGVPTANLKVETEFIPRVGVYFTRTWVQGKAYKSITNVGFNPTFESNHILKVETHIFDFNQEIYGLDLKVELLKFHRDEMKFSGIEQLKSEIQKDFSKAEEFFALNW